MNIFILEPNSEYIRMFTERGWEICDNPVEADAIQFTGGEDVTPKYYTDHKYYKTNCNPDRDRREFSLFYKYKDKPKLGICRGSQFLWALNGGRLFQHVDDHGMSHEAIDLKTKTVYEVSSTHHQMMMHTSATIANGKVLAIATHCTNKEWLDNGELKYSRGDGLDIEAAYFPKTRSLCFQPHPEFHDDGCRDYYFKLINRFFPELTQ